MKNLDKQVQVYSLGTYSFFNNKESKLHNKLQTLKGHKKHLMYLKLKLKKELEKTTEKLEKRTLKSEIKELNREIKKVNKGYGSVSGIENLKLDINKEINKHEGIRTLRNEELHPKNVISIFDSVLTRTLEMKENEVSDDIIVITCYHLKVFESLIKNGFVNEIGERYIYFSSSAGQIRLKKGVWIKKSLWDEHHDTLTCGLSVDEINAQGGCNVNKYLSYKALIYSASVEFEDFDINKTIVVDDLEMIVNDEVDYIHRDTYKIERTKMDVPVTITDGVGMMLPTVSDKNFMVRLPHVKGLLAIYDFKKQAQLPGHTTKITDIYGREWDIVKDEISIIFTKSQFKMWKYYSSWEDYKKNFNDFNCQAAKLNEEDEFNDGKLAYQMLQSLTDVTDEELRDIASLTVNEIRSIDCDLDVMLKVLGVTETNEHLNSFQQALLMYPELINDEHAKETIKNKKKSLVQDAKCGKLNVRGAFTFIIPDLYMFCEHLFKNDKSEINGLLNKNEVHCQLHESGKVAILRSPHLSREWGIRNNVIDDEKKDWFMTDAIYVSNWDLLSKLIQCDFDGDKVLVLNEHKDSTLVKVAERNMNKDKILSLYYEMEKADPDTIDNNNIYNSLVLAFEANIGTISNNITKVWNSNKIELDVIRWLCMESNFSIDYAKTLFKPTRPANIDEKIKKYENAKLPYFFSFDKRKNKDKKGMKKKVRVESKTNSTVNRLDLIIPNKRINFKKVAGSFDVKMVLKNPNVNLDDKLAKEIIARYTELDQNKKDLMKSNDEGTKNKGKRYVYIYIRNELLELINDPKYIADVLTKYLFEKGSKFKTTLWESFGKELVRNLDLNLRNMKECEDCGEEIERAQAKKYCEGCAKERERKRVREYKRKKRNENKSA